MNPFEPCEDCGHEIMEHGPHGCTETILAIDTDGTLRNRPCRCESYEVIEEAA